MGSGETFSKGAVLAAAEERLLTVRQILTGIGAYAGLMLLFEMTWRVPLPYDEKFSLVIYLMWAGRSNHIAQLQPLLTLISKDICYAGVIILLAAAQAVEEFTAAGFHVTRTINFLPYQYFQMFE